jgi:hypothetical protein
MLFAHPEKVVSMPLVHIGGESGPARRAVRVAGFDIALTRVLAAVVCGALIAVPFLAVRFPPITDLPQHVAQIRLFLVALGDPNSGYVIQWYTPYSAAYVLLGAAWALSTPTDAGRLAVLVLALLWMLALHALAARRRRPLAAAILASVLFFSNVLYWGFLSFAVGWLAFVVWFLVTAQTSRNAFWWRKMVAQAFAAVLLYASHALWLAFGLAWLVLYAVAHRWTRREMLWRFAAVAPVMLAAALWYPHLASLGFVSPTVWATPPFERLSATWIVNAVFGGIYGPAEYLAAATLLAWILGGMWQHRAMLRTAVDWDLLWTGMLMVVLGLTLPDQYTNTIVFAERWLPAGTVLIVLAAPAPRILAPIQPLVALATVAVFCFATTLAWMSFERDELSGLSDALAALPDAQRVIGLDLVQDSDLIKGRPFIQTFAYAQVLHGGRLNMSFAGHAPSLVVYRERGTAPWTDGLEWFAQRVGAADFTHFDYALINGRPDIHAQAAQFQLVPVTERGRWRLYRVRTGP